MSLSFVTNAHCIAERKTSSSLSSSLVSDYKKWVSSFPLKLLWNVGQAYFIFPSFCVTFRWTPPVWSSRRLPFHSRPGKLSKLNFRFLFSRSIQNEDKWNRLSNRVILFLILNIHARSCWIDRELTSRIASNAPKSLDVVWLPNFHCPFTCTEWQPKKEVIESPCRKSGPASTKESIKK